MHRENLLVKFFRFLTEIIEPVRYGPVFCVEVVYISCNGFALYAQSVFLFLCGISFNPIALYNQGYPEQVNRTVLWRVATCASEKSKQEVLFENSPLKQDFMMVENYYYLINNCVLSNDAWQLISMIN